MEKLPGKLITRDNLRSMQVPNVCSGVFPFGIRPQALRPRRRRTSRRRARASATRGCAGARGAKPEPHWFNSALPSAMANSISSLLSGPLRVVNVGLAGFARDLAANGRRGGPGGLDPAGGRRPPFLAALSRLSASSVDEPTGPRSTRSSQPSRCSPTCAARESWSPSSMPGACCCTPARRSTGTRMCGPMRGAVCGAIVFEGWAPDLERPTKLAAGGGVAFHAEPPFRRGRADDRHHHALDAAARGREPRVRQPRLLRDQRGPRQGDALRRQRRRGAGAPGAGCATMFGPAARQGDPRSAAGSTLKPLIARGPCAWATRCTSATSPAPALLLRAARAARWRAAATDTARSPTCVALHGGNDQFFLNVAMAMGKAMTDPARGIAGSTIVTAMCRNGTDFGIRVTGLGDALVHRAGGDAGRASISPASRRRRRQSRHGRLGDRRDGRARRLRHGGRARGRRLRRRRRVRRRARLSRARWARSPSARNPEWTIPALDFAGMPTGIDVRRVVETGIAPAINTGIAHRMPGVGQVGAGVARAPLACFEQALLALRRDDGSLNAASETCARLPRLGGADARLARARRRSPA